MLPKRGMTTKLVLHNVGLTSTGFGDCMSSNLTFSGYKTTCFDSLSVLQCTSKIGTVGPQYHSSSGANDGIRTADDVLGSVFLRSVVIGFAHLGGHAHE